MTLIKALFFFALVLVLGIGFAWLADRPGELLINWQGQQVEMPLMAAVSLLLAIIVTVMLVWWIIRLVLNSPQIMSKFIKTRRKDRGYKALSQGLVAAGAGDATLAKRLTKQSKSLIGENNEPLVKLLEVQTAMIEGRDDDARTTLADMSEKEETAILGLRGLYLEAKRVGAHEAASQYAIKAADKAPHLGWAGEAAIEADTKNADWDNAIRRLERQRTAKVIAPETAKRKKAILLTGRALSRSEGDLKAISDDALSALALVPDLVPAATIAAKALFRQGQLRKGSRVLEKIWREQPHPQVAETYVAARVGDTAGDRLKRAKRLENLKGNHVESLFIVAKMALEAKDYELAKTKAQTAAKLDPREGMYLLMADIEEAETGDQGRVRHWLAHALRAPRDPQWTADGYVSEEWAAISPVSGKLDVFEWKVPLTALTGPIEEGDVVEEAFNKAYSELPALAAVAPLAENVAETDTVEETADPKIVPETELETVEVEAENVIELVPQSEPEPEPESEPETTPETGPETGPKTGPENTEQDAQQGLEALEEKLEQNLEEPVIEKANEPIDNDAPEEELDPVRISVDDPGVDKDETDTKKSRFRLF